VTTKNTGKYGSNGDKKEKKPCVRIKRVKSDSYLTYGQSSKTYMELYVDTSPKKTHLFYENVTWDGNIKKKTRKNCFRYLKLMSPLNAAICTTTYLER
jgi:hypothetical protein